jgi:hypothetical protein
MFQMFFSFPRWFAPSVDGEVLPDTPEKLLLSGQFSKVRSCPVERNTTINVVVGWLGREVKLEWK